jgi:hypothetical protein
MSGEDRYSPEMVKTLKPMIAESNGCVGGYGIKIYPDACYVNLYRWLFDDAYYWRRNIGYPLPLTKRPYPRNCTERQ